MGHGPALIDKGADVILGAGQGQGLLQEEECRIVVWSCQGLQSARRNALQQLAESVGGTVESFYYAFGADDGVAILDVPDNVSLATAALLINASGAVTTQTTVLLTPEDIDEAVKRGGDYRPPGRSATA